MLTRKVCSLAVRLPMPYLAFPSGEFPLWTSSNLVALYFEKKAANWEVALSLVQFSSKSSIVRSIFAVNCSVNAETLPHFRALVTAA